MANDHSRQCSRIPISLILAVCAAGLSTKPLLAQDHPPQQADIQQMQQKLEQLENEIEGLKRQMSAAAESMKVAVPGPSVPVTTDTRQAEENSEQAEPSNKVDFYGFVMLDSGYNFGTINPDWFDVVRPTQLPSFPGEFAPNGKTYFGVRQTRFGVKTFTDTPVGELKTIFEFELFGTGVDAGQTTFRLRQAYGELGHFGAGQTWSPFMDIDVFPNSLEYWGPNGMVFFRNVQVRWMPLKGNNSVTVALERPGASADQGSYSGHIELQNVVPQFKWPDLSGNTRFTRKWGYVQIGGILRKIAWVDTNPVPFNLSGSAVGWGVSVSSNLYFTRNDTGKFEIVYGRGIENYMNDAPVDIGIKNTPLSPVAPIEGVALPVLGVVSFLDHNWSNRFSTSLGFSMENISNSDGQLADAFHQGYYALGNLLYHPIERVTMGSEFQFGRRVNFHEPFNVNDYRVQFSFRYDWSKGYEF